MVIGKIGNPYAYKRNLSLILTCCAKISAKWIINLNVKTKIIKPLEENIGESLHDLGLGRNLLDITPKKKKIFDKLDFIKT